MGLIDLGPVDWLWQVQTRDGPARIGVSETEGLDSHWK
jgi:hypothetical protein